MNMARVAALRAGFPDTVPGVTINRFCSSGLQAIAMAAERIRSGGADIIIAGGAESMSLLPMSGHKFAPNPWMVDHIPQIYMGMGLTAEEVYRKYNVSREDQDAVLVSQPSERAEGTGGGPIRRRNRAAGSRNHGAFKREAFDQEDRRLQKR